MKSIHIWIPGKWIIGEDSFSTAAGSGFKPWERGAVSVDTPVC